MGIELFEQAHVTSEEILPLLRASDDPMQMTVFQCIRGFGGAAGGVSLCAIRCMMPCTASTLTHHLNTLREAGLIETQKRGRLVHARVQPEALARLATFCAFETK